MLRDNVDENKLEINLPFSSLIRNKLKESGLRIFIDTETSELCIPFGGGITVYSDTHESSFCFVIFENIECDLNDGMKAAGLAQLLEWLKERTTCGVEINEDKKSIALVFCISKEDCLSLPSAYFLRVLTEMVNLASHIHLFMMAAKIERGMTLMSNN